MSTTSIRTVKVVFSEDVEATINPDPTTNTASPGSVDIVDLSSGANTITVPTGGGSIPTACTIIPPTGNTISITLKGVTGDTGIRVQIQSPPP